jgi:NAD(P)-dependent dehydrogenase (short-subunit alcohol dehydrogenase family)
MTGELADKVVLVTGAARGMGREYVRGFLREGARVVATDVSWAPSGVSSDDTVFADELKGDDRSQCEVNEQNGFGGLDSWGYAPDLERS